MSDGNKRIERIIKRAIDYNNGLLTPDSFALLEEMDSENEDALHISAIKRDKIIKAVLEILAKDDADFFKPEPKPIKSAFSMSADEFRALPLHEQNKIYKEHPDEVRELLSDKLLKTKGQITKDRFLKMPKEEQEWYYEHDTNLVEALLDGRLSYIDSEA